MSKRENKNELSNHFSKLPKVGMPKRKSNSTFKMIRKHQNQEQNDVNNYPMDPPLVLKSAEDHEMQLEKNFNSECKKDENQLSKKREKMNGAGNRVGHEGFDFLGFNFEVDDTAYSMAATVVFMVLFYFGLYIRHCEDDCTIGLERF